MPSFLVQTLSNNSETALTNMKVSYKSLSFCNTDTSDVTLDLYVKEYPEINWLPRFDIENFNIQWYPKNGGFKRWHCERNSRLLSRRALVFATYLYEIKNGGTEFSYLKTTVPSKKGLTVIFPTDFTHAHRSEICNEEKMLLTGWFGFKNDL